jgi:hypothetical protein
MKKTRAHFPRIKTVAYEGPGSANALAFRHYNPDEQIDGAAMSAHLRFSIAYWHSFRGVGGDPFGPGTIVRPWEKGTDPVSVAKTRLDAAFEFFQKIRAPFWAFHDRDIAPEGRSLARIEPQPRSGRRAREGAAEGHRREAVMGHRQSVLQPALHVRSRDEPGRPRLRLRRGAGEKGARRDEAAWRRELRFLGRPRGL